MRPMIACFVLLGLLGCGQQAPAPPDDAPDTPAAPKAPSASEFDENDAARCADFFAFVLRRELSQAPPGNDKAMGAAWSRAGEKFRQLYGKRVRWTMSIARVGRGVMLESVRAQADERVQILAYETFGPGGERWFATDEPWTLTVAAGDKMTLAGKISQIHVDESVLGKLTFLVRFEDYHLYPQRLR